MKDYQERVIREKQELDIKIVKLTTFIYSDGIVLISQKAIDKLQEQLYIMMSYSKVLTERIVDF